MDYQITQNKVIKESIKRNFGLDLLRIFSMINIIILHINLYSGNLRMNPKNYMYRIVYRLEIFAYFPVNCFGILSGIIGYKRYKFANVIYLWFIALSYSILETIISFDKIKNKKIYLILTFLPILKKFHWYMNAYFIIYFLFPFLNYGINYLDEIFLRKLVVWFVLFFSFYHILHILMQTQDYSFLLNGYSSFWLMILYIIGGYLGKYVLNKINSTFIMKFFFILIYFASSLLSEIRLEKKLFINYLSPTILFQSFSLIFLFYQLKIENKFVIKIIKFITPLNFSVTLIHLLIFKRDFRIIIIFLKKLEKFGLNSYFFGTYCLSIIIYIICIFIDLIRLFIFNTINVRKFCEVLVTKI